MLNRKIYLFFSLFCLFIFGMLNAPMIAYAADYYVDKINGDDIYDGLDWLTAKETIGATILRADPGDGPDTIHVAAETYPEIITFKNDLSILGGYPAGGGPRDPLNNTTTIDGNNSGSVVTFYCVTNCTIDGFTIQNGNGTDEGAGYKFGGGIYCYNSSSITISYNHIINNVLSITKGGGIYSYLSSPIISHNKIMGNSAYSGGGVYCETSNLGVSPVISVNIINTNTAIEGGGISISGNTSSAFVEINNNEIKGNVSSFSGGGIHIQSGRASITNNTIADNTSSDAGSRGGGVSFLPESWSPGTAIIKHNLIYNNHTAHNGGGIEIIGYGTIAVDSNIIAGNLADYGGGIRIDSTHVTATVVNNLIENNTGTTGGGIRVNNSAPSIINNTIVNNPSGSGISIGVDSLMPSPSIVNNIIWGNNDDIYGATLDMVHYSNIGDGDFNGSDGNISSDPLFVDPDGLDNIPGNEDDDYHIMSSSPCIDAGTSDDSAPATDYDGDERFDDPATEPNTGGGTPNYYDIGYDEYFSQCDDDVDCGFCEKCVGGICVDQAAGEDLKNQCDDVGCGSGACDGAGACGVDPAGTECRVAAGECDVAETCDGTSASCPADGFKPAGIPCEDGLFCTESDSCDGNGTCLSGSNMDCDDGQYCNGVETCNEGSDQCVSNGDPCTQGFTCDEDQDACYQIKVSVGNGSGFRGTKGNSVEVSLDNPHDAIRGIQIDICDTDDYLSCIGTACEPTNRTPGFICQTNELGPEDHGVDPGLYGCCRILLVSANPEHLIIEEGTGPIFTIKYDVSKEDPGVECKSLNPVNIVPVPPESPDPLVVLSLPGQFCISDCMTDQDCDDSNDCTDDSCESGSCDYINNTASCDDGLFCNGDDTCSNGVCTHSGDPCAGGLECNNTCQEATQTCYTTTGTACTDEGNVCTDDECNGTGSCIHPNNTDPCSDGIACTEGDVCSGGVCSGTPNNSLCSDGEVCTDDICTIGAGCSNPSNTASCDDSIACTENDACSGGVCNGTPNNALCDDNEVCTYNICTAGLGCDYPAIEYTVTLSPDPLNLGNPGAYGVMTALVEEDSIPEENIEVTFTERDDPNNAIELSPMAKLDAQGEATVTINGLSTGSGTLAVAALDANGDEIPNVTYTLGNPTDGCATLSGTTLTINSLPCDTEMTVTCEVSGIPVAGYLIAGITPTTAAIVEVVPKTDNQGQAKVLVKAIAQGQATVSASVNCGGTNIADATVAITQCDDNEDCNFLDDQCNNGECDLDSESNTYKTCLKGPLPDGTSCNDGIYCNGTDSCNSGSCSAHSGISCPAGTFCDESLDACIEPTPVFKVSISPASATAYSAETIQFTAKTRRNGVIVSGDYEWEFAVNAGIGSSINPSTGLYTAGNNDTATNLVETIKVTDTDRNISATAKVTVKTKTACEVVISPASAEVKSSETVEFSALTTCNGVEEEGTYQWVMLNTTIGSTINASTGLYTAGTTDAEVTDTIQVTDTAHGNITATALVTVTQATPPVCNITIEPSDTTVDSGATITFTATVEGEDCLAPDFSWEIDTDIHSEITPGSETCAYQAGSNTTGILVTDTITVTDVANGTSESVTVTVLYGRITGVFPPVLLGSRWLPLFHIMIIFGEDTGFNVTSTPSFTPDTSITTIGQIGLGDLMGVLVLLSSNAEEGPVDLAVNTTNGAGQEVTFTKDDAFIINLLPFLLDESENRF